MQLREVLEGFGIYVDVVWDVGLQSFITRFRSYWAGTVMEVHCHSPVLPYNTFGAFLGLGTEYLPILCPMSWRWVRGSRDRSDLGRRPSLVKHFRAYHMAVETCGEDMGLVRRGGQRYADYRRLVPHLRQITDVERPGFNRRSFDFLNRVIAGDYDWIDLEELRAFGGLEREGNMELTIAEFFRNGQTYFGEEVLLRDTPVTMYKIGRAYQASYLGGFLWGMSLLIYGLGYNTHPVVLPHNVYGDLMMGLDEDTVYAYSSVFRKVYPDRHTAYAVMFGGHRGRFELAELAETE